MGGFPTRTAITIALFAAIAGVPEFVPAVKNYRIVSWDKFESVLDFKAKDSGATVASEVDALRPREALRRQAIFPLEDPGGSLDHFFAALHRTEAGEEGAITRILHYGDSPTTADLITADMRAALQEKFGDGGHGFVLIGKPWAWYGHRGVDLNENGWLVIPANLGEAKDGMFGLGGVSFRGSAGATAEIRMNGSEHKLMEVAYLEQPGEGKFSIIAEGHVIREVETNGPAVAPAFARVPIPYGARNFGIRVDSGDVRVFGAEFLTNGPGVVYSSLGLNGAYISVLTKMFREQHWVEQLRHYKPDLVVINYGTNESVYAAFVDQAYTREIREAVRRIRTALPDTSILIMSPMDRGERDAAGNIATVPALARLVTLQQRSAAELGCAFFNTYEAMGGAGTMGRWYSAEPRLVSADFIHPTPGGARMVGNLLYRGLMNGYFRYKLREIQRKLASAPAGKAAQEN
jgi:lysophospholipase L1-like esterase